MNEPAELIAYEPPPYQNGSARTYTPKPPAKAKQGRVPPHSIEAEMSVLGSMMLGDDNAISRASDFVAAEDFYRDAHAHIFQTVMEMFNASVPVDVVTLRDALDAKGILEPCGGVAYLMSLGDVAFTTANVEHYAKTVAEKAGLRKVIEAAASVAIKAYSSQGTVEALAIEGSAAMEACIRTQAGPPTWHRIGDMAYRSVERIVDRIENPNRPVGIQTGLAVVDRCIVGMMPKDLIIVGGMPGHGKTAFAVTLCRNVASAGIGVALFSAEMPEEPIADRFIASESQVNSKLIKLSSKLSAAERNAIGEAQRRLEVLPIYTNETSKTIPELRASLRRLQREDMPNVGMVVVDYLQYLEAPDGVTYQRDDLRIADVAKGLKQIGKDFKVTVVALAQLNRATEKRNPPVPMLSDLDGSSRIGKEADMVLFLYWPGKADKSEPGYVPPPTATREDAFVIVNKNRDGETGTLPVGFAPALYRFDTMAEGIF